MTSSRTGTPANTRTVDWTHELTEQLAWHWDHLRRRLETLSDAEYLWEPVSGAWSLRPRADAVTPMAGGIGDTVADFQYPEPEPAPLTTIAWRMGHISIGIFGERAANHFGSGGVGYETTDWPLTAAGGLELLDHHYDAWMTGVRSLDDHDLAQPCGPTEGPFAEYPFAALVLHINREAIHHGAEICLLRDLHQSRHEWIGART